MKKQEKSFKEQFFESFNKGYSVKQGVLVLLVVIAAIAIVAAFSNSERAERSERIANYYQSQHYQGLKEAEIQAMTARDSYEYAVKMFNIDAGRYLYQDLRMIGFVLAVGIMLGLTFHGFKLVYVRRNG